MGGWGGRSGGSQNYQRNGKRKAKTWSIVLGEGGGGRGGCGEVPCTLGVYSACAPLCRSRKQHELGARGGCIQSGFPPNPVHIEQRRGRFFSSRQWSGRRTTVLFDLRLSSKPRPFLLNFFNVCECWLPYSRVVFQMPIAYKLLALKPHDWDFEVWCCRGVRRAKTVCNLDSMIAWTVAFRFLQLATCAQARCLSLLSRPHPTLDRVRAKLQGHNAPSPVQQKGRSV